MPEPLPNKIRVGPRTYTVVDDDPKFEAHNKYRESRTFGTTIHYPDRGMPGLTIAIDVTLPQTIQQETLLHEVIHAIDYAYASDRTGISEQDVAMLAVTLLDVLQRNPAFVKFLLEETD